MDDRYVTLPCLASSSMMLRCQLSDRRPRRRDAQLIGSDIRFGSRAARSFASTLKVQRSAVGSGSGRLGRVWPMSQLGRLRRFDSSPANGRNRRILVVAGRPGEGPFTIRFADLRHVVSRTATYALASRLRASWIEARVTKVAKVSARFSKFLARRRLRPNQEKVRRPPSGAVGGQSPSYRRAA
jgi:hypothetical protein